MSDHTTVTLDAADAVELAELLEFLNDWLHHHRDVAASYQRVHRSGCCTLDELRADLARFAFLLGGDGRYLDDEDDEW